MHCLDTNVVISILSGRPPRLMDRFEVELEYGIAKSERRRENQERLAVFLQAPISVLPFDADDAREAGEIRAALAKAGTPIGPYDILIAAQARRRGATLVTANAREFARVPGLKTEDWAGG
jgi:tRNA(fMet)-specific endonuclease VapC